MNALAIALHGLAAALWVGGMFFAYVVLRPTVAHHSQQWVVEVSGVILGVWAIF